MRLPSLAAALAGFITLSLELLGFRVLAPYFGYSIYVFGSLIGLVLLALAVGYLWGGRQAEKISDRKFAWLALGGAIYIALAGVLEARILESLADLPLVAGSFLAALVIFGIPMVIFASVAPRAVARIHAQGRAVAHSAGEASFWGTLGSLAGTFATSFWLLPVLGVRMVFLLNAVLGLGVVLLLAPAAAAAGLVVVAAASFASPARLPGVIASEDSAYSHLEVVDFGARLGLRTEMRSGTVYSAMPKSGRWDFASPLYNLFAAAPAVNSAKSGLLLGLGAGTLPLIHEELNPDLRLDAVELDPEIVALGRKYFHLGERRNLQSINIEDARPYLRKSSKNYDLVEIDLFRGGEEIPFYLVTREFFGLTREHLAPRGILAMNIYDPSKEHLVKRSILASMATSFPYIYEVSAGHGSYFILAGTYDFQPASAAAENNPALAAIVSRLAGAVRAVPEPGLALSDNKAPLERFYGSPL